MPGSLEPAAIMMWSSLPTLSKENGFEPFKLDSGGTDTQGNDVRASICTALLTLSPLLQPQNINRYVGQPLRLTRIQGEQPGSPSMGVLYPDLSARELFGTGNKDFVNGVTSSIEGIFLRQQPPSAWDAQARPLETPKQDQDGHRDTHDDFGLRREGRTRDRRTGRYERNPSHSLSPEPNCSQKGASSRQNRDIPGCDSYRYDEWSRGQSRDQDGRRSKGRSAEKPSLSPPVHLRSRKNNNHREYDRGSRRRDRSRPSRHRSRSPTCSPRPSRSRPHPRRPSPRPDIAHGIGTLRHESTRNIQELLDHVSIELLLLSTSPKRLMHGQEGW